MSFLLNIKVARLRWHSTITTILSVSPVTLGLSRVLLNPYKSTVQEIHDENFNSCVRDLGNGSWRGTENLPLFLLYSFVVDLQSILDHIYLDLYPIKQVNSNKIAKKNQYGLESSRCISGKIYGKSTHSFPY